MSDNVVIAKNISRVYDKYVYMSICEITLELHKDSKFATHSGFCIWIGNFIQMTSRDLNQEQWMIINKMVKQLSKIYSMDDKTNGKYIADFFYDKKYIKFERP